MASYQNSILIGVKLQDINTMKSNLQTELDKIKGLKTTISKVGLDTNVIKNDIQTQLNGLNFTIKVGKVDTSGIDTVINKTKQATQEAQQFKNVMGKSLNIGDGSKAFDDLQRRANEIRSTVDSLAKISFNTTKNGGVKDATITYTDNMGKLVTETMKWKEVMSSTEGVVKRIFTTTNVNVSDNVQQLSRLEAKFESIKSKMQGKLTTAGALGIDTTLITQLQTQLNGLNARTPISQINQLQQQINALGGNSTANINKLQNAINTLTTRINSIKSSKTEIISSNNITELRNAQNEVNKLKQLLAQVKSGKIIDGKVISAEVNTARNSVNQLSSAINNIKSNGASLGSIFKNIFSYAVGGSIIYAGLNQLRQGLKDIKDVDDSLRDLKRVSSDVADSIINDFTKQANAMAISLGNSTESVIQATTTFKQLGYSWKEAKDFMASQSITLANVGDMTANDSASAIVATLKGFRLEAKDTTMVVDSLNEAGNRFAIKTGELAEGLRVSSAALALANNNLQQSEALITAGTEVLRDSNAVGVGLKTISMRLNQVKTAGGETFFKLKKDLKDLADTDLTDMNGNLRSTYDVILDLSKAFESGKLSDMDKSKLLDETAGKQQAKVMASILQNASKLPEIYQTLQNSAGSALQEQERYMDSISGKLNAFKETVKAVWLNLGDSNGIKSLLSGSTNIVGGLNNIIKVFGALPTVIGVAITALTMFNTRFRASTTMFTSIIPAINSLNVRLATWTTRLNTTTLALQRMILYQKEKIATAQADGVSTTAMGAKLSALNVKLAITQAQLIATKVATIGLQTALSLGGMLAIGAFVTVADNIINAGEKLKEFNTEYVNATNSDNKTNQGEQLVKQYETLKSQLQSVKQGTDEYREKEQQLANVQDQLIQLYPQANDVIDKNTGKKQLNIKATQDLIDKEKTLNADQARKVLSKNDITDEKDISNLVTKYKNIKAKYDDLMGKWKSGVELIPGTNGSMISVEHELDLVGKEFEGLKSKIDGTSSALNVLGEDGSKFGNGINLVNEALGKTADDATNTQGRIQLISKAINELDMKKIIPNSTVNSLTKLFPDISGDAEKAKQKISQIRTELSKNSNLFSQSQKELSDTGSISESTLKKLADAFPDLGINSKNAKESIDSLTDSLDTLNGTEADAHAKEVAKATDEYQKSTQAIAKAQGYIDKLNKSQAVTPVLAGQISKKYDDVGTSINSLGSTIDFLKGKIKEQQEAQQTSLMILKGDDSSYYSEKVANNENYENQINDFLARFTGNSQNAYDVDLSQFTTLNQMKAGVQGTLKTAVDNFLSQFVDTSAEGYKVDYSNFENLMSAKGELLKQMAGSMASFWDETAQAFNGQAFGGVDLSGQASDSTYKAYENKAQGILDLGSKIKGAMGKLDGIYSKGGLNFKGFDGGGGTSDFSGTGKDKSASDAKKAQEELEKAEKKMIDDITDAYNKAKDIIQNDIEEIDASITTLGDADDSNFTKRIDLTTQKIAKQGEEVQKATEQLNALKNVSVTTADAQETLENATLKASKELRTQTLEVYKLNQELKKMEQEQLKKIFEAQKEIETTTLEENQKAQTKALEDFTQAQSDAHDARLVQLEAESKALDDENDKIEKANDLEEKKLAVSQAQYDLERAKNSTSNYNYQKQADGSYGYAWTVDKKVLEEKQKTYDEAKKSLEDTKRKNDLDEAKANIDIQKTNEENLYKEKEKLLKKHEETLKSEQEREKARLEEHYSDIETLTKETLDQLAEQYNNNWNAIADSIETRLTKSQQYLKDLKTLMNNFSEEDVQKAISSGDVGNYLNNNKNNLDKSSEINLSELTTELNNIKISQAEIKNNTIETEDIINYSSESKNQISEIVEIDLQSLEKQVSTLQDTNKKIEDEYDSHYKKLFDKQTKSQNEQQASLKTFAEVYTKFTDQFLELVQIVYDYRFTNIVSIGKASTDMIVQALVVAESAFEKIVDIWNQTHKEEEWIKNIDISTVVADMDTFKESVLGYTNSKAGYYEDKNNPLYNEALRSNYTDTSKYAKQSAYTLDSSNLLSSMSNNTTNNNSSAKTINQYSISDVKVNAENVSEFIDSITTLLTQDATIKK